MTTNDPNRPDVPPQRDPRESYPGGDFPGHQNLRRDDLNADAFDRPVSANDFLETPQNQLGRDVTPTGQVPQASRDGFGRPVAESRFPTSMGTEYSGNEFRRSVPDSNIPETGRGEVNRDQFNPIPPRRDEAPRASYPPSSDSSIDEEDIIARGEDRRNQCRVMGWAHILVSERWSNTNLYIGIPSTIFAAIASVQAISELGGDGDTSLQLLHIIFSITVAGLAPLLTFLNPSEKANSHKMASRVYEQMADRYDAFVLRCDLENKPIEVELDELVQINREYAEAKKPLPVVPEWAYQKAITISQRTNLAAPMAVQHDAKR
ncbi:MAG: SLATT domain-containing protein [Microcoleaceae cyanobacterium]